MRPLAEFPKRARRRIKVVLTDIDDTLTTDGRLTARAYAAMERLRDAGFLVIPVTGRPAGWCDHIARMWPVDAVVGENGAFYFRYDHRSATFTKRFLMTAEERAANRGRLDRLQKEILAQVPGAALASDQSYRVCDLAIDYCEDVPRLGAEEVTRIIELFERASATAKLSSIHVNGWFGDYDKLAMTRILLDECFGFDLDAEREAVVFVGDSPNDVPMFAHFPNAIGVANLRRFEDQLAAKPAYLTSAAGGGGFAQVADVLCAAAE